MHQPFTIIRFHLERNDLKRGLIIHADYVLDEVGRRGFLVQSEALWHKSW